MTETDEPTSEVTEIIHGAAAPEPQAPATATEEATETEETPDFDFDAHRQKALEAYQGVRQ